MKMHGFSKHVEDSNKRIIEKKLYVNLVTYQNYTKMHGCSKHVEDSNKHIIEKIVGQVAHLLELYEDARSEIFKLYEAESLLRR